MNGNHTHTEQMMNEAIRYALRLYRVQKHELAHSVKYLKHHLSKTIGTPQSERVFWVPEEPEPESMDNLTSVEKKVLMVALKYLRDTQDRDLHQMMA